MAIPFGPVCGHRRAHFLRAISVTVVALACAVSTVGPAEAADERLEKAQAKRRQIERQLETVTQELEATRADVEEAAAELERLRRRTATEREQADAAARLWTRRVRESYKSGSNDPVLDLLTADDPTEMLQQARLMSWVATQSREDFEHAEAAATRLRALTDRSEELTEQLRVRRDDLAEDRARVEELFDEAVAAEKEIKALIAKEEAARRAAARRVSRSSRGFGGASAPAEVRGGVACPVGGPRSYVNSWGAPRSGGRRHMGTDILAPHGTPTPAYESGVISRMSSNGLGGISLYLAGDSGNQYYYTHLSGYANVGEGQRVSAGQVIAYVGSTGNAGGINHLHFEVRPGGGGHVNPYPYVIRACG
jgi:peptidoglycan LD-endopeptidase LytH